MKLIKIITALTILAIVLVLTPWIIIFYGEISTNPTDWSSFGSYLGGTLSPIIALMALIGLLYTINQQQKQISHISNQSTKEDLFKATEKVEKDFHTNLNRYPVVINTGGTQYKYSAVDVLLDMSFIDPDKVIFTSKDIEALVKNGESVPRDNPTILSADMFATAASHLNQIKKLVIAHDKIAKNNALTMYYTNKYKTAYRRLHNKGLINELWEG